MSMISAVDLLIKRLSKMPGLGPRSARRAVLDLIKNPERNLHPLIKALQDVSDSVTTCEVCHNIDIQSPCKICEDAKRQDSSLCVVADVSDVWAIERSQVYRGKYHVLGGTLSAMEGRGPEQLNLADLKFRVDALTERDATQAESHEPLEIILALGATVGGQTTVHYVEDMLSGYKVKISHLSHGLPVGGELDYLDDGTLSLAFKARR